MCRNCLEQVHHLEMLEKAKSDSSKRYALGMAKSSIRTSNLEQEQENRIEEAEVKYA